MFKVSSVECAFHSHIVFVRFIDNLEIIGSKRVCQFLLNGRLDLVFWTTCERLHGSRKSTAQQRVCIHSSVWCDDTTILFLVL